ncbi:hypothetical protein BH11PSE8_BH11PSE8_11510 [soil metagenome]
MHHGVSHQFPFSSNRTNAGNGQSFREGLSLAIDVKNVAGSLRVVTQRELIKCKNFIHHWDV